jgi:hypothetical protein
MSCAHNILAHAAAIEVSRKALYFLNLCFSLRRANRQGAIRKPHKISYVKLCVFWPHERLSFELSEIRDYVKSASAVADTSAERGLLARGDS